MKRITQCITFKEGEITKHLVMISCGESLNPLSVHCLSEDFGKVEFLGNRIHLTDSSKFSKLNDWDEFRWDNPELPVSDLDGADKEKALQTIDGRPSRWNKRQIPRYKTQSVIALDIA